MRGLQCTAWTTALGCSWVTSSNAYSGMLCSVVGERAADRLGSAAGELGEGEAVIPADELATAVTSVSSPRRMKATRDTVKEVPCPHGEGGSDV